MEIATAPPSVEHQHWNPSAQTATPQQRERRRAEGLQAEWDRIWETPIPFHRERLAAAGFEPGSMPPLEEIPRFTKADVRRNEHEHPPFGLHRAFSLAQAVRIGRSTGTTGKPPFIMLDGRDMDVAVELMARSLWRSGLRPGGRWAHGWPGGMYVSSGITTATTLRMGILEIPVGLPTTQDEAISHLEIWRDLRPDSYMLSASQLAIYADAARATGSDLRELLEGTVVGLLEASCQFPEGRKLFEDEFGVEIRNWGGVGDIPGFGCTDCRHHTGLHVPDDHVVVEVCDPQTGRALPEGERGTLVVSTTGMGSCFLRYDVEDVATLTTEPCPCGETGPRYTLIGRAADAVTVDGRTILPLDVQLALLAHGAPEFRIRRTEQEQPALRLEVEWDGPATPLAGSIGERLGVPVAVEPVAAGSLPRSAFKPRRTEA